MPRLFIAIDLPPEAKNRLEALQAGSIPAARPVGRSQMHLTLKFLGDVDGAAFRRVRSVLAEVRAAPFVLGLRGVGCFPPRGAPRVLWAGLDAPPELAALHGQLEQRLAAAGFPPEERDFSPHITLARFKTRPPGEAVARFLRQHAAFAVAPFPVGEVVLYSSLLRPDGPRYTREQVLPLMSSDPG